VPKGINVRSDPAMIEGAGFPCLAAGAEGTQVLEKFERISQPLGTCLIVLGGRATVALESPGAVR
jgi:hypothetical protein